MELMFLCEIDGEYPFHFITEWIGPTLKCWIVVIDLPEYLLAFPVERAKIVLSVWIVIFAKVRIVTDCTNQSQDILEIKNSL